MDKDIGKIKKGEYQGTVTDIVVGVREYNGKVGVDIREFASSEKYTGPTKKGLRIPADNFKDFKKMINSITDEDLVASEPSEASSEKPAKKSKAAQEELPDY
ncbi:MAG TPA: transcriptional coactivator p15/PC4 family protein [Candidatus Nanoarchaeia archaeon]|nr:transcriptional coactivator p15/PC4 family protein [Candidatus Nanoarchaeia archaeon]